MWALLAWGRGRKRVGANGRVVTGIRIIWLMPTLKQFKAVHGALLLDELAGEWAALGAKIDKTTFRIELPDGSWVQPFPAAEHRSQSARGLRADVLIMDEADDIDRSVYESVARPWFSESWSYKIRLAGGTPKRGRHGLLYYLHKLGLDPSELNYATCHATYRDSPETVDPAEAEDARKHSPPATFAREWECDFDSAEGLVYAFDERFHVREPPPDVRLTRYAVGVDHGYSDPGCFLLGGIQGHGEDAVLWILEEVHESGRVGGWWDDKARPWQKYEAMWWCDPSQPARIKDLSAIVFAKKANNHIDDGVGRVANLLAIHESEDKRLPPYARLYISPRCVNLIREMGLYRRKKDPHNSDRFLEAIEDRDNHCIAKGVEVTTDRGTIPIEEVRAGERVLTRSGFRNVQRAWKVGTEPTWTLSVNGAAVTGTSDHRVWSTRGWIPLCSIQPGDEVLVAIASPRGGDSPGSTTSSAPVQSAGSASPSTDTARSPYALGLVRVESSPQPSGLADVYDLAVDEDHEFFAGGVLVHNCQDALRYLCMGEFGPCSGGLLGEEYGG